METPGLVLCDTDVLIEFFKGNDQVVSELSGIGGSKICYSVITFGEIYFGLRDKQERAKIASYLKAITQVGIDEGVCQVFNNLMEKYALSHKPGLADAFIASTCISNDYKLYTLNQRHFKYIKELKMHI